MVAYASARCKSAHLDTFESGQPSFRHEDVVNVKRTFLLPPMKIGVPRLLTMRLREVLVIRTGTPQLIETGHNG